MTDTTPNLALPQIIAAQAQKHITHNEALRALDVLVHLAVLDRDLAAPPGLPASGQRWLVAAAATGAWAGHSGQIAAWQDGDWQFYAPQLGWLAYVVDEGALLAWTGIGWVDAISAISSLNNMTLLGLGTMADALNPFSAKLNNTLWLARNIAESGTGDLRWKMNKEAAGNTLSMLFQTAFSSRAEIGLTGDDDLRVKVSADGTTWLDALRLDRTSGKLTLGQGFSVPETTRGQLYAAPFDALAHNGLHINGGLEVSQELGASGATLVSGTARYTADMWKSQYVHGAGTAVVTSGQVALGSFPGYAFGHRVRATTAIAVMANGDYAKHVHLIEGYRMARLAWGSVNAQPLAYAFQFNSTAAGTAFMRFGNAAGDRFYYKELTVSAGWNFFSGTIPGDTTGTWAADNATGLVIEVFVAGKAASPATPGSWGATATVQTINSTNLLATNGNTTVVTGLVVLPGLELPSSDRLPLFMRPTPENLLLCQRYFQSSYNFGVTPGTVDANGHVYNAVATTDRVPIVFNQFMRVDPAMTAYNSSSGATGSWRDTSSSVNRTVTFPSVQKSRASASVASSLAGNAMIGHWTADARL
jgi:hypothetical protein